MSLFYKLLKLTILLGMFGAYSSSTIATELSVVRLNDGKPIITPQMFEQAGAPDFDGMNINGPSLIKIPEWLKASGKVVHKDANYYLYFAHHNGKYIRLAWANKLQGPYHLYGVNNQQGRRGVLDLGKRSRIDLRLGLAIQKHVASPDVFVDNAKQTIAMYFHAPIDSAGGTKKEQKTFVATSKDGVDFNQIANSSQPFGISPVSLGTSYFRVFNWKKNTYAIANGGALYREPNQLAVNGLVLDEQAMNMSQDLWVKRSELLIPEMAIGNNSNKKMRHAAILIRDNELWVFYTRIGDSPERILLSRINLTQDWLKWKDIGSPVEVMRPQKQWEGIQYMSRPSKSGRATQEQALRDPYIYEEAGKYYLLYTGAGEEAIGLARLDITNN